MIGNIYIFVVGALAIIFSLFLIFGDRVITDEELSPIFNRETGQTSSLNFNIVRDINVLGGPQENNDVDTSISENTRNKIREREMMEEEERERQERIDQIKNIMNRSPLPPIRNPSIKTIIPPMLELEVGRAPSVEVDTREVVLNKNIEQQAIEVFNQYSESYLNSLNGLFNLYIENENPSSSQAKSFNNRIANDIERMADDIEYLSESQVNKDLAKSYRRYAKALREFEDNPRRGRTELTDSLKELTQFFIQEL